MYFLSRHLNAKREELPSHFVFQSFIHALYVRSSINEVFSPSLPEAAHRENKIKCLKDIVNEQAARLSPRKSTSK